MVKKLLKHEFIYYLRTFGLFIPIIVVVGIMTRVFIFFDSINNNDNVKFVTEIISSSSATMLAVSCMALLVLSTVISIVRFYKNMYSSEGYLTFTLPVTNAQHIFVKLLAAITCQASCVLTVILAASIALSGEPVEQVGGILSDITNDMGIAGSVADVVGIIIEVMILAILTPIYNMLLYYMCITIGQTAKKNRIFMAVGAYFVYYFATQVIGTVFSVIFALLVSLGALESLGMWIINNAFTVIHMILCFAIVGFAAISTLFWVITHNIMSKKLNLE